MGEAKRRQRLDPNFGLIRRSSLITSASSYWEAYDQSEAEELGLPKINEGIDCYFNQEAIKTIIEFMNKGGLSFEEALEVVSKHLGEQVYSPKYFLALEKSQGLFIPWFDMVNFASLLNYTTVQATINFLEVYSAHAAAALGQVKLNDARLFPWFRRLRGISLFVVEELSRSLDKPSAIKLALVMNAKKEFFSLWDTTLEIGLAFARNNVIYNGQALIVYKGFDSDSKGRGELMVATKHSSGCWSHYPSSENLHVPFSDYKQAKLALEEFPLSLRGELYHPRSSKLARLLGLTVNGNYAYLVKNSTLCPIKPRVTRA
jgi:hypothetical protein